MTATPKAVQFHYKNWQGKLSIRRVIPNRIYFGCNDWHPKEQWLLDAWDMDRSAFRSFAMADITNWTPE